MSINEAGILLIRPSPVKKFWTLDTQKETGSIGSTLRRVETLWGSVLTCQDMVVRHKDFNWSIFDLEQFLLEHSDLGYSCFLYEDPWLFSVFLIETVKYSRKCLVIASLPIWAQQSHMSHMVLQKRAMKELWDTCSSLSWDWLPLKKETGTHIPHGYSFQQLWWSCGPILQRSDRWATGCLWFVCEIEVGWQFQVSWHLQRLGTSNSKVLCWKVGTWRRWRQVIPVSRLRTIKYHL